MSAANGERPAVLRGPPGIEMLVGDFDAVCTAVTIGAATQVLAAPNPSRFALAFSTTAAGTAAINFRPPASGTDGFILSSVTDRIFFNFRDHGVWPTLTWYSRAAGAFTILVWESIYRPRR